MRRRDFLRITAAGSALLGTPGWLAGSRNRPELGEGDPLQVAVEAAAWIRAHGWESRGGLSWPVVPGEGAAAALNLYSGTPGVVLFLLELHHATGDPAYLMEAQEGAFLLQRAYLEPGDWADAAGRPVEAPTVQDFGLYTGRAGAAFTVAETSRASGDDTLRSEAESLFHGLMAGAQSPGEGIAWYETGAETAVYDVIGGSAGIGLSLLYAHENFQLSEALDGAVQAGRYLVTKSRPGEAGLKWPMSEAYPRLMPNFSHGTAGVAYFLARLAEVTGDEGFLDAAIQGARYLQTVSRCRADGCLVFHNEPEGEDLFYLGWCHGPTGTARLFHQIARVTGEAEWTEWVLRSAKGIRDQGIPENRPEGYWNNVSQCCGDAGVGDFFLSLAGATGDGEHAGFARHLGEYIMGEAGEDDSGVHWTQAEHRTRPEFVQAQTGWMQGAAGVGAFFLHLDGAAKGRAPRVVFPDSPWVK
jgi:lantibiotic modifying enzyme